MSDTSVSASEPELDPQEEEEEEEEEEEDDDDDEDDEADEEDGTDEENDGDDEDETPKKEKSQSAALGADGSDHGGEDEVKQSATSGQSGPEEKAAANDEAAKLRLLKPANLRRNIRKLLREDQLEAQTKTAQQEELERRKRLEQQRKDYPLPIIPTIPAASLDFLNEEDIELRPAEVSQLVGNQEIICLDSSSCESDDDSQRKVDSVTDEVIELSSGEEDSLHVVDSGDSLHDADHDLDIENSGSHVNDALNLPDAFGQVLVNINHPPNEKDLFLSPQLAQAVKPHQVGGIRFLYDNLVESLDRFSASSGFGCILAHSMGLGKTLQVISFLDVLFQHTSAKTVLAIVPVNTLQNWLAEFNMWLPAPEALPPDHDVELLRPRSFNVHTLNDEHKTTAARAKVVNDWVTDGGVLLMGYEMFRLLSLKKSFTVGRKKRSKKATGPVIIDLDEEDRQQEMLKGIEKALSRPGPDVVICDEGHRIKNCHASTSQALKNIRTRRRVVLTGYPLQNNLIEYWCMVDFVRPDFLGTRQEFSNMFERPILNGQCMDSTPQDKRLMRYRSHVLHSLLEGFVQRRGHTVLKAQLPSKEEHVIMVRLSPIQRALYTEFMNRFRDAGNSGWLGLNPLKAIWNHPDVLYEALQKENLANEKDLDIEDLATNTRCQSKGSKVKTEPGTLAAVMGEAADSKLLQGLPMNPNQERANQVVTYEWAKEIMFDYQPGQLQNSPKMVLLFHLIEESMKLGDKLLVFSQSLSTLSIMEEFLVTRPMPPRPGTEGREGQTWVRNVNYYRLDGSTSASERERLINQFNDPSNENVWLFLLSTRAGCLGVNLIGANRVVVFDASWNPCHDAQAVCRVYRYGQRKPCHIYRLVSDFTLERKIYDRQITKQGMSDRVVDDLNPEMNFTRREVENLLHFVEEEPDLTKQDLEPVKFSETVLQKACIMYPQLIHFGVRLQSEDPFQHESLLLDRKEQKLTVAEKKAAKRSYEEEKRASVPYSRPSYTQYYPAPDHSLGNIPAFSHRNWRSLLKGDDRPVASVRPLQSTPIPMMPRHMPANHPGSASGSLHPFNFPVNYLQRAGVLVQKVVTTTDIVIPGMTTSTDVQARISAGESIHVIRGTKGTYIRTSDGRIFAIRSSGKKSSEPRRPPPTGAQPQPGPYMSNGRHTSSPASQEKDEQQQRPASPDSPEILGELHQYRDSGSSRGSNNAPQLPNPMMQPQSLNQAPRTLPRKRKEPPPDQLGIWPSSKRHPYTQYGYPGLGGFGVPPSSMNHGLARAPNSLYMGAGGGSSPFQLPSLLSDPQLGLPLAPDSLMSAQPQPGPYMSNGRHTSSPASQEKDEQQQRPASPDSPEILGELHQYRDSGSSRGSNNAPQLPNPMMQPQSLNQAPRTLPRKRKEPPPDQLGIWPSSKRHPYTQYGYPGLGGFGVPPSSMNHGLARAPNSLYMGAGGGSSPFQLPSLLSDPQLGLPLAPDSLMTASDDPSPAPAFITRVLQDGLERHVRPLGPLSALRQRTIMRYFVFRMEETQQCDTKYPFLSADHSECINQ
ncbi:PREDICTED: helicase ARIP4 [Nanorana parkeri]|uniref:helicase ARIP4 n=1 Tax=Nanorana parkeri TaxID=125878 RepID=UPI00085472B4|nr:PREDICTED: helicase ARIP4 [Nanorana parkeri]